MFAQICRNLSNFSVKLNIDMFFLAKQNSILEKIILLCKNEGVYQYNLIYNLISINKCFCGTTCIMMHVADSNHQHYSTLLISKVPRIKRWLTFSNDIQWYILKTDLVIYNFIYWNDETFSKAAILHHLIKIKEWNKNFLIFTFKWKCIRIIISPSQGWNKACLILLYRMSTLSPRTDVKRKPKIK